MTERFPRTALELDLARKRREHAAAVRKAERAARPSTPRGVPPPPTHDDPVAWFRAHGWEPFAFQEEVWRAYRAGESGLVHAATGTGKTYAAWMGPVLEWLERHPTARGRRTRRAHAAPLTVLWITPLRALAADTEAALKAPVEALGLPWTIETRTGDTSTATRSRQRTRLPTALITTPESLSLLLARDDAREIFGDLRLVVVDEWHELMGTKRGVQVELALARLHLHRSEEHTSELQSH